MKVLVVGAGIVGSSTAYFLSARGIQVHLIDAHENPSDTSRASLGVLTHFNGGDDPYSTLYRDGHALHAKLAAQLRGETGIDVGWRPLGGLDVVFDEEDRGDAEAKLAHNRERGCRCEWLDAAQLRQAEPNISERATAGVLYPDDHRVDPSELGRALREAAQIRHASVSFGTELVGLELAADGVRTELRCDGSARLVTFDVAVIASGSWSSRVTGHIGVDPHIKPIRGQHCRYRGGSDIRHVLRCGSYHMVPTRDALIVGATVEEVEFDLATTQQAATEFSTVYRQLLGTEPLLESQWAGLRPKPRKGRPVIAPLDARGRAFIASGHYKNGVLLGPITGRTAADWVVDGDPGRDMSPFALVR